MTNLCNLRRRSSKYVLTSKKRYPKLTLRICNLPGLSGKIDVSSKKILSSSFIIVIKNKMVKFTSKALSLLISLSAAASVAGKGDKDTQHHISLSSDTVHWGYFSKTVPPGKQGQLRLSNHSFIPILSFNSSVQNTVRVVITIESGETVTVEVSNGILSFLGITSFLISSWLMVTVVKR